MSISPRMIALPSKGAIADPALAFFDNCGLRVDRPNLRQYTGTIPAIPSMNVLFQRATDVLYKVADGTTTFGVTGLDVVHEHPHEQIVIAHPSMGFGRCRLAIAVPEAWIDVDTLDDLAEIAADFRQTKQRNLRIATKFTYLTRRFLHNHGIHHFTLVNAEGAIEAAPTIGYADVIIDLIETGTTLRENHLKPLSDGTLLYSQACLIANRDQLGSDPWAMDALRVMLEHIDAALEGKRYSQVVTNIRCLDLQALASQIVANPVTRGLQGPTIAPIHGIGADWHTMTIIVENQHLLSAVEALRALGGAQTTVTPVRYLFREESPSFARVKAQLNQS